MINTTATADRAGYDAWVDSQLALIHADGDATNSGFDIWDDAKIRQAKRRGVDRDWSDASGFAGPWHIVRAYASQEFIWWVEGGKPRWTFGAWQAAMRAERLAEETERNDPARNLDSLEYLRDLESRKGELIAAAREGGSTWAQITAATGMSRMACHTLAKAHTHPAPVAVVAPVESADDVAMREHAAARGFASWADYAVSIESSRAADVAPADAVEEVAF